MANITQAQVASIISGGGYVQIGGVLYGPAPLGNPSAPTQTVIDAAFSANAAVGPLTVGGHLLSSQSSGTVGAAAGANAGTSPPAPVLTNCTDVRGSITCGTGTTPAAGALLTVTFGTAYTAAPIVHVQEQNSATKALNAYVSAVSTTGFTVSVTGTPAASQANTVYSIGYAVIG